ncbi:hypothetical protein HOD29_02635 [archaeon]|jgi:hypothetical protein|nr:hypothetical protein [archaeon]
MKNNVEIKLFAGLILVAIIMYKLVNPWLIFLFTPSIFLWSAGIVISRRK